MDFEFLEHTADLKFRAYGASFGDALINAAYALKSAFVGDQVVGLTVEKKFTVSGLTVEEMVHDFLSELIFLFETEHYVAGQVSVAVDAAFNLVAECRGGVLDFSRHRVETEVKACTYHDMQVKQEKDGWVIQVVCDI
ncbi:MAG: archease [Candidatus Altiarchaeota archaeon]